MGIPRLGIIKSEKNLTPSSENTAREAKQLTRQNEREGLGGAKKGSAKPVVEHGQKMRPGNNDPLVAHTEFLNGFR